MKQKQVDTRPDKRMDREPGQCWGLFRLDEGSTWAGTQKVAMGRNVSHPSCLTTEFPCGS